ncbi:MAG: type I-E CRISPR-associated endoribonuclease Cas2e [Tetrasphaera jenkinsii]|jgi:CRISPR-associated protein Cas2|nr:type I-E CRISPR-associated endoribonuclease Cas2e [Tetrasphaera jenkinsii]
MTPLCVLVSSSVPTGIRGALNQWMIEILPGMFVGRLSARIRDELWSALSDGLITGGRGYAALVEQKHNDQGFEIRRVGDHPYEVNDFDGLQLVTVTHRLGAVAEVEVPW